MGILNEHKEFERDDGPRFIKLGTGKPRAWYGKPKWRRVCRICRRVFMADAADERYCPKCRRYGDCEPDGSRRRCPMCGRPVTGRTNRVYCSSTCSTKAQARKGAAS